MPADPQFRFDAYRLEVRNEQLWCGAQPLRLTAKAFRVLAVPGRACRAVGDQRGLIRGGVAGAGGERGGC